MIATISGNVMSFGSVESVPTRRDGQFSRLEESTDADKNAGQNTQAPYLAELRRNGVQEQETAQAPRMARDPLGRGRLFDYVA